MDTQQPPTPYVLTDEHRKAWYASCAMLRWQAGGFSYLFTKLLNHEGSEHTALMTTDVPYACTDGKTIMINPEAFFKFKVHGQAFILAHEVVHNVYNDVNFLRQCAKRGVVPQMDGTTLPFREDSMQRAMDHRINHVLIEAKIGAPPKDAQGKVVGHYDPTLKGTENLLDIYKKCYKEDKEKPEGSGGGNPGGFDAVLPPGTSQGQQPDQAAQQRNTQQWAVEVAAAQMIHLKQQGSLSAGLKRMFDEVLAPEVHWLDHIQTLINRLTGSGGWNWKQPDEWWTPHDFFSPRRTGRGAGWIVVWGDTSGSRDDKELASTIGEMAGIIEDVNPARLTMLWCDAAIKNIEELSEGSDLRKLQPKGGGGTSVQPVYNWIDRQVDRPDLFIGFTDGHVSFPKPPIGVPVIWASSTDKEYPYGQVVRVNKRGAR